MYGVASCIKCSKNHVEDEMYYHWCDNSYKMCSMCFYEVNRAELHQESGTQFLIVRKHPEWNGETWGWKSEKNEIKEDGGNFYGN